MTFGVVKRVKEDTAIGRGLPTWYERLEQTVWWVPRDGRSMSLIEMTPDHRKNLIAFLERHAEAIAYWYVVTGMEADVAIEEDGLIEVNRRLVNEEAVEWMRDTPLYKMLVALDERWTWLTETRWE